MGQKETSHNDTIKSTDPENLPLVPKSGNYLGCK